MYMYALSNSSILLSEMSPALLKDFEHIRGFDDIRYADCRCRNADLAHVDNVGAGHRNRFPPAIRVQRIKFALPVPARALLPQAGAKTGGRFFTISCYRLSLFKVRATGKMM